MIKASQHAKRRAGQRLNVAYKAQRNKLFNKAIKYGHPPNDFAGPFKEYLIKKLSKVKGTQIKVYDKNIFIYKKHLMITVFPVPNSYLPIENYFVRSNPTMNRFYDIIGKRDFTFDLLVNKDNEYVFGLIIEDEFICFGKGSTRNEAKNNLINNYIKILEGGNKNE